MIAEAARCLERIGTDQGAHVLRADRSALWRAEDEELTDLRLGLRFEGAPLTAIGERRPASTGEDTSHSTDEGTER